MSKHLIITRFSILIFGFISILSVLSCNLPTTSIGSENPTLAFHTRTPTTMFDFLPKQREAGDPIFTPTPDPFRTLPQMRSETIIYTVKANDTLGVIATTYGVSIDAILSANDLVDPNILSIGQTLEIPPPLPGSLAPYFKIIPDSELVNGPYNAYFVLSEFVNTLGGHLSTYQEEVDGELLSGTEVVELVSRNYSVNPRLLLALLEYQSGWVTQPQIQMDKLSYPMGIQDPNRTGLYLQLTWTANNLNSGYYMWRVNALGYFTTTDGITFPASPEINAGTAGVQFMLSQLLDESSWRMAASEQGLFATYQDLFGYPFDWAIEPLIPENLTQPTLQLPFEPSIAWTFTGGPHGGWGGGSAWAAIDFAPPKEKLGCTSSDEFVVAMADGVIVRSENGIVVQDLDGDGNEETGWTLLYLHIETRHRIPVGSRLKAGNRIGHPSCEGGYSTGTHVHIARRYNGEWIPADQSNPFILDGWVSSGDGIVYEGYLQQGDQIILPCQCRDPEHTIQR